MKIIKSIVGFRISGSKIHDKNSTPERGEKKMKLTVGNFFNNTWNDIILFGHRLWYFKDLYCKS